MNCPQFIVQCFAVRTAAHLMHLSTTCHSQHIVLGDFYDELLEITDRYAEVYMGLEGPIKVWPGPATVERKDPLVLLEDFLETVQAEQPEDADSQALVGILADMEELAARTLYKLRHMK